MKNYRSIISLLIVAMTAQVSLAGDVITVCGQNVQNFFYSLDRGRTTGNGVPLSNYNTAEGRQKKAQAIIDALAPYEADIYAFNEVEAKATTADTEALEMLAQMMSEKTGLSYQMVNDGMTYDLEQDATGQIKSGFIYRTDRMEPVGDNVSTAVGYTTAYPYMMRMQCFRSLSSGEAFMLSMNHFKASTSGDMDGDMTKREQNSIALLKGLDQATDPDILVLGDLNSEMGEQCLNNLTDAGYEEQIIKCQGSDAFSYWYQNNGKLIDHVFANGTMAQQITDAKVLYIANPHSTGGKNYAYSDHDPYLVKLNLEAQPKTVYRYTKATEFSAGARYLMVAPIKGLQAACPVSINKSYEYQQGKDVTEENGIITMEAPSYAFLFETAPDGGYYMKDYYGRYAYQYYYEQSGSYSNSTSVGIRAQAHPFDVIPQADGTFKILDTASDYYFLGVTYKGSPQFALYNYASPSSSQHLPWLYQYNPDAALSGITELNDTEQPEPTRKVIVNGRILIVRPDGTYYNLQGIPSR